MSASKLSPTLLFPFKISIAQPSRIKEKTSPRQCKQQPALSLVQLPKSTPHDLNLNINVLQKDLSPNPSSNKRLIRAFEHHIAMKVWLGNRWHATPRHGRAPNVARNRVGAVEWQSRHLAACGAPDAAADSGHNLAREAWSVFERLVDVQGSVDYARLDVDVGFDLWRRRGCVELELRVRLGLDFALQVAARAVAAEDAGEDYCEED